VADKTRKDFVYKDADYVRISSLELVSSEIYENNVNGNVAELGVFEGNFAQYINVAFPDKKLYLFDTFKGFDDNDIENEKRMRGGGVDYRIYPHTNIDIVLKKMKYKENCVIVKGYFPETVKDLEDTFAFVSIDADLFAPIYSGLTYFYPRLERGGYIFIHDYGTIRYQGTKMAVKKYCSENNISYFPLTDYAVSAVISK
jgi:O-methyltransferase